MKLCHLGEVFVLSLALKLCSFDACQLFAWSSLKQRSFEADLSKIKHIKMMMCHLIAEINSGRCIPNGTKFQAVKSSFKIFGI